MTVWIEAKTEFKSTLYKIKLSVLLVCVFISEHVIGWLNYNFKGFFFFPEECFGGLIDGVRDTEQESAAG